MGRLPQPTGNARLDALNQLRWAMAGEGLTVDKVAIMTAVLDLPEVRVAVDGLAPTKQAAAAFDVVREAARALGGAPHARILRASLAIDYEGDARALTGRRAEFGSVGEPRTIYDIEQKMLGALVTALGGVRNDAGEPAQQPSKRRDEAVPVTKGLVVDSRDVTCRFRGRAIRQSEVVDVWRAVEPGPQQVKVSYFCASDHGQPAKLEVLEGGRVVADTTFGRANFRVASIALPLDVPVGTQHRVRYQIAYPRRRESEPWFVLHIRTTMLLAVVRVAFDPENLPRYVWRVEGLLPEAAPGERASSAPVVPDAFGYCEASFDEPEVGLVHGIGWEW